MTPQTDPEQNEIKHLHALADFKGKRVLEIGCGEGRLTWQYAGKARSTIAVDVDQDALRVAMIDRPAGLEDTVHLSLAASEQLPLSNKRFDMAIFSWSF
jgi:ubiquinone/menaquinone biosynthesis C-methylase UbiE